eukprot:UN21806
MAPGPLKNLKLSEHDIEDICFHTSSDPTQLQLCILYQNHKEKNTLYIMLTFKKKNSRKLGVKRYIIQLQSFGTIGPPYRGMLVFADEGVSYINKKQRERIDDPHQRHLLHTVT